ncbi:MAG: 2-hydroxyglutaryl-CoA dehydratase [Dehalococcoidales bacterium]|nr:2-hydroxyglutaryl-CoA dehydratase [Dehalococcoidales bacterium]
MAEKREFYAGIDLGSTMTKIVIIDRDGKTAASIVRHTGSRHQRLAEQIMQEVTKSAGMTMSDIAYILATGYGRINVPFANRQMTELTCHARGVYSLYPGVRVAIDIGGQDSKVMLIRNGKLIDFVMNDKCAAGTGRFLDVLSESLGLKVEDLGEISAKAGKAVSITSPCTVFIRQEIAKYLGEGARIEDIVAGLHDVIAGKVARLVKRFRLEPDVVFTGGVAKNSGVVKALEKHLGCSVLVPDEPLLSGALGAALLGKEIALKNS